MKSLKNTLSGKLFYFIILLIVFISGTFYPNFLKVKQIEYSLETKYIEEAKQIALFEPEFTYETNEQFILAMRNCINFVNFGLPLNSLLVIFILFPHCVF